MKSIRTIIVDDHSILRAGMRTLLEKIPAVEVVAEFADGRDALAQVDALQPDAVFMDISMNGMNGLETTRRLAEKHPGIPVLMLSMHALAEYVEQALHVGAKAYLLKDSPAAEIEKALAEVLAGEIYLAEGVSHLPLRGGYRTGGDFEALGTLSDRQRETLKLLADGKTTKQIAGILGLSVKTVETHRSHLMDKLKIDDLASLVRYALRTGLVNQ